jgi:acetyl esterase/lipase
MLPPHSPGAIFYVHGGGYISGSCSDHRGIVAKLAQGTALPLLLYEYRLAPEHTYPAALDDTLTAYQWLLAQGVAPAKIIVVGESAGGGLALAALLALRDRGIPLPAAAAVMSPWTDLKHTGDSYRTRADVAIDILGMAEVASVYYAGDHDPALPTISPLYGDLRGLPPLRIDVGDYEILRDDAVRFAEKARAAGVQVQLTVGEGMVHCYPLLAPLFPEATAAMREICAFIQAQVARSPATV